MPKKKKSLATQLREIEAEAKKLGMSKNPLYTTTLDRYKVLIQTADNLAKEIENRGYMYETVSAKGEPVLKINPAVTEYNKTSTVANNTAKVLNEILEKAGTRDTDDAL